MHFEEKEAEKEEETRGEQSREGIKGSGGGGERRIAEKAVVKAEEKEAGVMRGNNIHECAKCDRKLTSSCNCDVHARTVHNKKKREFLSLVCGLFLFHRDFELMLYYFNCMHCKIVNSFL